MTVLYRREEFTEVVGRIVARPLGKGSFGKWDVWEHDPAKCDAAREEIGERIERAGGRGR